MVQFWKDVPSTYKWSIRSTRLCLSDKIFNYIIGLQVHCNFFSSSCMEMKEQTNSRMLCSYLTKCVVVVKSSSRFFH